MQRLWISPLVRASARTWIVPAAYMLIAVLMGPLMPYLDQAYPLRQPVLSQTTGITLLLTIAAGMLTFTGLVFSMSFVLVQFGSNAYSPRLTRYFLEDPIVQHALGVFTATFLYALVALAVLDARSNNTAYNYTLLIALGWVLASVILFLALIQHLTAFQVTNVLHMIGDRGRLVIERQYPDLIKRKEQTGQNEIFDGGRQANMPALELKLAPLSQTVIFQNRPLTILDVNIPAFVKLATGAGCVVKLMYAVGDQVPDGAILFEVHGGKRDLQEQQLLQSIWFGKHRSMDKDPRYALRLIIDVAIKALSPSVNDPTTAVQALDQLDDLMRRIGERVLDVGTAYDRKGVLRVVYPVPTWEDYMDLAFHEIRIYGATSIQVTRRLVALLQDLYAAVPEQRKGLVRHHLERIQASIQRSFVDERDRWDASQPDRQGIGLGLAPRSEK